MIRKDSRHNPAKTYTLEEFIDMQNQDEMTYINFAILRYKNFKIFAEESVINYYMDELKNSCIKVEEFTSEEILKYKYSPDLLAYDIYGSVQLDFIVMLCNGMIDPKEFDFKKKFLMLPRAANLSHILSAIYNSESKWMNMALTEVRRQLKENESRRI